MCKIQNLSFFFRGFDSYYLDTDPGQPEFTPPGIVSLTKVDQPVIGKRENSICIIIHIINKHNLCMCF